MTKHKVGDIVSVEFPFSNLQTQKRRPGLVLIAADQDLLLARVNAHSPRAPGDVSLARWTETGLPRPSTIRMTKLATADHRLVHHKIGHLHRDDSCAVAQAWEVLTATRERAT